MNRPRVARSNSRAVVPKLIASHVRRTFEKKDRVAPVSRETVPLGH